MCKKGKELSEKGNWLDWNYHVNQCKQCKIYYNSPRNKRIIYEDGKVC